MGKISEPSFVISRIERNYKNFNMAIMAYCNSYNSVKLNDNYYRTLTMHLTGQFISICLKRSLSFEEFKGSSSG